MRVKQSTYPSFACVRFRATMTSDVCDIRKRAEGFTCEPSRNGQISFVEEFEVCWTHAWSSLGVTLRMGNCQGSLPTTTKPLRRDLKEKLQGPIIIFMIGGPGSGKGLQSTQMAQKYNFSHVAIGDLLREEASRANSRGRAIRDIMLKGALVPSGYIVDLLINNMLKADSVKGFIIEGFPRDINQAKLFEEVIIGEEPSDTVFTKCCSVVDEVIKAAALTT